MRYPVALLLFALMAAGCGGVEQVAYESDPPYRFVVDLTVDPGAPDRPLPLSISHDVRFDIRAIGTDGGLYAAAGARRLRVFATHCTASRLRVGSAYQPDGLVTLSGGAAGDVTVALGLCTGRTRIVVEDVETYNSGSSAELHFPQPTLSMVQTPLDGGDSPFNGRSVIVARGDLIVTGVFGTAFCVTDLEGERYNHAYVYTFGPPLVDAGDRIGFLTGEVQEFYGLTEISGFPVYRTIPGRPDDIPAPVELTGELLAAGLEPYEGALVRLRGLTVAPIDRGDYLDYDQWPVALPGGGKVDVISREAAPAFNPLQHEGQPIACLTGNLTEHIYAANRWIVRPRSGADIVVTGACE